MPESDKRHFFYILRYVFLAIGFTLPTLSKKRNERVFLDNVSSRCGTYCTDAKDSTTSRGVYCVVSSVFCHLFAIVS